MLLSPCPICGSTETEEDWTACSEIAGTCWQSGLIQCGDTHCHHGVTVSIDSDRTQGTALLQELWNLAAELRFERTYVTAPRK